MRKPGPDVITAEDATSSLAAEVPISYQPATQISIGDKGMASHSTYTLLLLR